ncbi:MAG: AzlD domain-containing protein [Pseudomonadota bacterium]
MTIIALAMGTFAIRLAGVYVGQSLAKDGAIARGLNALPGCLIVSLVASSLAQGGLTEWLAAGAAAAVAIVTRSLPLTMGVAIAAVFLLRQF